MKPCWKAPLLAGSTLALCAACATAPEQTSELREEKVYQTGSMLPMKDRHGMMDVKTVDPASLHQELGGASHAPPVSDKNR